MEWQPIETAPKDGTRVLIYSILDDTTFACGFDKGMWQTGVWRAKVMPNTITYWMPLPNPPTEGTE